MAVILLNSAQQTIVKQYFLLKQLGIGPWCCTKSSDPVNILSFKPCSPMDFSPEFELCRLPSPLIGLSLLLFLFSGFTIELGAAMTVLAASKIGIPISTTHCKVGSIFVLGMVRSRASVEWKVFRNIFLAWVVTLPITAGISALLMFLLQLAV